MSTPIVGSGSATAPAGRRLPAPFDIALSLVGAVAGACLGNLLFHFIARQGFYGIILPGALAGIGCGGLSRGRSVPLGIACGIIGLAAGVFTEWQFAPFVKDGSLSYFLTHLHQLRTVSQGLILLGAVMAVWFGIGRTGGVLRS